MSSPHKVYIIILNYNGWEDTIECLQSLFRLTYRHYHIVVIDNHSPNNSLEHLTAWAATNYKKNSGAYRLLQEIEVPGTKLAPETQLTFIKAAHNGGFAAGNNLGIRLALNQNDCDYLWLLNNDTTVAEDSLTELVKAANAAEKQGEKIGIWGSKLLFYHQPDMLQAVGGKFNLTTFTSGHIGENQPDQAQYDTPTVNQDYVVGAAMFVSRNFVKAVGLLDDTYFLYFEEMDWATRARQQQYKLGYVWKSKVYHKEGKTIGSHSKGSQKSALADYHGIRSKIIFVRKFYPEKKLRLNLLLAGSMALRLKRLQLKRAWQVLLLMLKG